MRIGCYHFAKKLNQSKYVSIKMIRCCFVSNADQRVHMDKEGMLIDYKILSAGCQFNNAEEFDKVFLHAVGVRGVKEVQRFVGEQTMPKLLVACNGSKKN